MKQISPNVFVGGDSDYEKVKDNKEWACLRCAKFGLGGHKDVVGYETQASPEGKEKYVASNGKNHLALNLLDLDDPNYVPEAAIQQGLDFIKAHVDTHKVLIACNHGSSRGPTLGLMWLRTLGRMPYSFLQAEKVYKRDIYPKFEPGIGIEQFAKMHWTSLLTGSV